MVARVNAQDARILVQEVADQVVQDAQVLVRTNVAGAEIAVVPDAPQVAVTTVLLPVIVVAQILA